MRHVLPPHVAPSCLLNVCHDCSKFEVDAPAELVAWDCNCSICNMKKNWHFMVPKTRLRLLSGEDQLSTYTFNTKVAQVRMCHSRSCPRS